METMRPSGPVKLESIESGLYKEVSVSRKKTYQMWLSEMQATEVNLNQ